MQCCHPGRIRKSGEPELDTRRPAMSEMTPSKQPIVRLERDVDDALLVELTNRLLPCGAPHRSSFPRRARQSKHRYGECARVARRDEQTSYLVLDDLPAATDVRRHNRETHGRRVNRR